MWPFTCLESAHEYFKVEVRNGILSNREKKLGYITDTVHVREGKVSQIKGGTKRETEAGPLQEVPKYDEEFQEES